MDAYASGSCDADSYARTGATGTRRAIHSKAVAGRCADSADARRGACAVVRCATDAVAARAGGIDTACRACHLAANYDVRAVRLEADLGRPQSSMALRLGDGAACKGR